MIISLIAAIDQSAAIGKNNHLPWHLSSDLKRFKQLTMGHHIVMGRKTYETIGRSLPGRSMIILTHQHNYTAPQCSIVHSLDEAILTAHEAGESELFIIGGGEIFSQAIALADMLYLTVVHTDAVGDVFFPEIDPVKWEVVSEKNGIYNENDDHSSEFKVLKRRE